MRDGLDIGGLRYREPGLLTLLFGAWKGLSDWKERKGVGARRLGERGLDSLKN